MATYELSGEWKIEQANISDTLKTLSIDVSFNVTVVGADKCVPWGDGITVKDIPLSDADNIPSYIKQQINDYIQEKYNT